MGLFHHPSAASIGVGLTLSFLDLCLMLHRQKKRVDAELWELLTPELLRSPSVVSAFEKAGLIETRRGLSGEVVELVYRGSGSGMTDIAEFLWRHKFGPQPAA